MAKIVAGFWVLLGCLAVSGPSWAGWQRDAVCQGSCGGACGPCGTRSERPDREERGQSAYDQKVDQYNELQREAHAAAKGGDLTEAIRIGRQALSVLDDDGLRESIAIWESRILLDEANRTSDLGQKIDLVRRALAIHDFREGREWLDRAEIEWEGQKLNDEGRSAYSSGDYALAERLFAQAQKKDPNPTYADNVRLASARMKNKQEMARLTEVLDRKQSTAATSDLDFMPADDAQPGTTSTTGVFGTTTNPANPELTQTVGKPVKVDSVLEQLSSSAKSGEDAKKSRLAQEKKELSNCGFDGAPCREPDPIPTVNRLGATPAGAELSTHIPEGARNDPAIQQSVAWYAKLATHQAETQLKLDELHKEMESGTGSKGDLAAKAATLENDLKHDSADQATAKNQIKKRLVDLSLEWNESPEQEKDRGTP